MARPPDVNPRSYPPGCALNCQANDGSQVRAALRDILFAALEDHFPGAVFEVRRDWPGSVLGWWEAVRLGLR